MRSILNLMRFSIECRGSSHPRSLVRVAARRTPRSEARINSAAGHLRVIADLVGNAQHVRTVPISIWLKNAIDAWTVAAGITHGVLFRAINRAGRVWGDGMSLKVLWDVVRAAAGRANIDKLAPHDLRRTCARLCHLAGGQSDIPDSVPPGARFDSDHGTLSRMQTEAAVCRQLFALAF